MSDDSTFYVINVCKYVYLEKNVSLCPGVLFCPWLFYENTIAQKKRKKICQWCHFDTSHSNFQYDDNNNESDTNDGYNSNSDNGNNNNNDHYLKSV